MDLRQNRALRNTRHCFLTLQTSRKQAELARQSSTSPNNKHGTPPSQQTRCCFMWITYYARYPTIFLGLNNWANGRFFILYVLFCQNVDDGLRLAAEPILLKRTINSKPGYFVC